MGNKADLVHTSRLEGADCVERVTAEGGEILYGGEPLDGEGYPGGHYVRPCIASAKNWYLPRPLALA